MQNNDSLDFHHKESKKRLYSLSSLSSSGENRINLDEQATPVFHVHSPRVGHLVELLTESLADGGLAGAVQAFDGHEDPTT